MVETVGRLFAAAPVPVEVRHALAERAGGLRIPGKVAPPQNWHITLRFLGVMDQVAFDRFLAALAGIEGTTPFHIRLDHFGAFPRPSRATVVWVGVGEGAKGLTHLNEEAEAAAVGAGLPPEERPFHPHLTLSRVRPPADARHLLDEAIELRWRCDSVVVYRSHLGGGPARYEPLETFDFSR